MGFDTIEINLVIVLFLSNETSPQDLRLLGPFPLTIPGGWGGVGNT